MCVCVCIYIYVCVCVCVCISHIIQLTPQKLNAERENSTCVEGASARPEDQNRLFWRVQRIHRNSEYIRISPGRTQSC